jgi:hypothetical protein
MNVLCKEIRLKNDGKSKEFNESAKLHMWGFSNACPVFDTGCSVARRTNN